MSCSLRWINLSKQIRPRKSGLLREISRSLFADSAKGVLLSLVLVPVVMTLASCAYGPRVTICYPDWKVPADLWTLECSSYHGSAFTLPIAVAEGYQCLDPVDAEEFLAACKSHKPSPPVEWCAIDLSAEGFRCRDGSVTPLNGHW